MKYKGDLYGKIAGKYIRLEETADDVDRIESQRDELLAALKRIRARAEKPGQADGTDAVYCFMEAEKAIAKAENQRNESCPHCGATPYIREAGARIPGTASDYYAVCARCKR